MLEKNTTALEFSVDSISTKDDMADPDKEYGECVKKNQMNTLNTIGDLQLKYLHLLSPLWLSLILFSFIIICSIISAFAGEYGDFDSLKSFLQVLSKCIIDVAKFMWTVISGGISSAVILYMLVKNRNVPQDQIMDIFLKK